ncbi:hypothetical protein [Paraburkholderia sp. DHOC27]|uniref:hypothetical protein n=1 Tax=Paraburkholderia sp. DHOC27 TaxID=2303330 RepID=UPI0015F30237|nr:hypothetical protein [Paraburkholderia sp. DHOC27]
MKVRSVLKRSIAWTLAAAAASALLAGCAGPGPQAANSSANSCVGPASFCNIYFGS